MKRLALFIGAWLAMAAPAHAQLFGGQMVFDPAMYARQLLELNAESQQVLTLGQQLQIDITQATGGYAGTAQPAATAQFLDSLGALIAAQNGLSVATVGAAAEEQQIYPDAVLAQDNMWEDNAAGTALNTVLGAFGAAQGQALDFDSEAQILGNLELQNQTAAGRMQAIQVTNELLLQLAAQLQMSRQIQLVRLNQDNVMQAYNLTNRQLSIYNSAALMTEPGTSGLSTEIDNAQDLPAPHFGTAQ